MMMIKGRGRHSIGTPQNDEPQEDLAKTQSNRVSQSVGPRLSDFELNFLLFHSVPIPLVDYA